MLGWGVQIAPESNFDLRQAVVVAPASLSETELKALGLLLDEVEKRTLIRWQRRDRFPTDPIPTIVVGPLDALKRLRGVDLTALAAESINTRTAKPARIPVIASRL